MTLDRGTAPARVVAASGKERMGRGAYLCRRQACVDRALHRRAFQRAFREPVTVDRDGLVEFLAIKAEE